MVEPVSPWDAFRTEVFRLYDAREYVRVHELLEREGPRFPDRRMRITYWKICLAAIQGATDAALRIFRDAVDHERWWMGERILRSDPDLASLQGLPEFERLVTICWERQAEAQESARPLLLVHEPFADGTPPYPLLIALHGHGGDAENFVPHWLSATRSGWLLAVPQSSQIMGPDAFGWQDRARASQEIQDHLTNLRQQYSIDESRIVIAGFSRGGSTAAWLALSQEIPARGFIAFAADLKTAADLEEVDRLLPGAVEAGVRGYLLAGDQDYLFDRVRELHNLLNARDIPCELEIRQGVGHRVPEDFAPSLARALSFTVPA